MEDIDFGKMMEQAKAMARLLNNTGEGVPGENQDNVGLPDIDKMMNILSIMQAVKPKGKDESGQGSCAPDMGERNANVHNAGQATKVQGGTWPDLGRIEGQRAPDRVGSQPIADAGIQAVKAAIPYLERRYQKKMWLFIKVMEIHKLMDMYDHMAMEQDYPSSDWRHGMLEAIRPYMSTDRCAKLDLIVKIMEIKGIMYGMEEMNHAWY